MTRPVFTRTTTPSPVQEWLSFRASDKPDLFQLHFRDTHIGNPLIRSIHGGITASFIEMSAEHALADELAKDDTATSEIVLISSSVDYLRITRDVDIYSRAHIVRSSRRMAFVDIWCWQDDEDIPIARGTCTLRIFREPKATS